jgi:hypothetical protein
MMKETLRRLIQRTPVLLHIYKRVVVPAKRLWPLRSPQQRLRSEIAARERLELMVYVLRSDLERAAARNAALSARLREAVDKRDV